MLHRQNSPLDSRQAMEEETNEFRADWLQHPYTQSWVKPAQKKAEDALKQLLADCSKSDDAVVRAAHAKYVELATLAQWFNEGKKK